MHVVALNKLARGPMRKLCDNHAYFTGLKRKFYLEAVQSYKSTADLCRSHNNKQYRYQQKNWVKIQVVKRRAMIDKSYD